LGRRDRAEERQVEGGAAAGSSNVAVYAVYPCREFMPAKVNVFIEYLAELYGPEPYWDKGLDLRKLAPEGAAAKAAGGTGKRSRAVAPAR
jgi:hypothetical protein